MIDARAAQDLDIIRDIEKASHFRDMVNSRGWELFLELKDFRIKQLEEQVLRGKLDKEALWVTQLRCQGVREFFDVLIEGINTAVETIEPGTLERLLRSRFDPVEMDGEPGLTEIP